jgi:hypothetical protein
MRTAAALTIAALILSGCIVTRPLRTSNADTEVYTRDQVDFLLLQAHCKGNARTLVQLARCRVE